MIEAEKQAIKDLKSLMINNADKADPEKAEFAAEKIMLRFLLILGHEELVETFNKITRY